MSLLEISDTVEDSSAATTTEVKCAPKLCMVCEEAPMQYKCPRCDYLTCSLQCCKQHKAETQCTGKRDRAAFVPMRDFKEKNLRSDFHFLEDILQTKDSALRTLALNCGGGGFKKQTFKEHFSATEDSTADSLKNVLCTPLQQLNSFPPGIKRLVKAAVAHNVQLVVMPQGMSRRTLNTTQYRPKVDLLIWRVHIVFIVNNSYLPAMLLRPESQTNQNNNMGEQSSSSQPLVISEEALVTVTLPLVEETKPLSSIIADIFDPQPGNSVCRHALRSLRPNRDSGTLRCLIQHLPSPGGSPLFCEIPLEFTLQAALSGRTVIEYPTLFFGSLENTQHLKMKVAEIVKETSISVTDTAGVSSMNCGGVSTVLVNSPSSPSSSSGPHSSPLCGSRKRTLDSSADGFGGGQRRVRIVEGSLSASNGTSSCPEGDDTGIENFSKQESLQLDVERTSKEPRLDVGSSSLILNDTGNGKTGETDGGRAEEGNEDNEEEEEEEDEDEGDFFTALKEFEGKDIEALKAFISSHEH